jgi:hypothetical protein
MSLHLHSQEPVDESSFPGHTTKDFVLYKNQILSMWHELEA